MIGAQDLAIGISLFMRDGFTAQANQAGVAMTRLQQRANNLAISQMNMARNLNAAGAVAGLGILNGVRGAFKEFAAFDYTMRFTALSADGTTAALDRLSNKALEVGKRTIFSSKEVAEGMRYLAQAGFDSSGTIKTIDAAANLAASTKSALEGHGGAADLLAKISTAFQIERTDANMKRVSDILAYGANESLTDLYSFGEGLKYTQNTAQRLKLTLEETTAAIMVLTNAGISNTMTGTTMDNFLRYTAKASGGGSRKQKEGLAMLGISPEQLKDARGNLLPLADLFELFGKNIGKLGTADAQVAMDNIFGARGARADALIVLMKNYKQFLHELTTGNINYAERISDEIMKSPQGQLDIMMSTWESLKIQFGGTVAPIITPLLKAGSKILDIISKILGTPFGRFLGMFGTLWLTMKTASMGYKATLLSIRLLQAQVGGSILSTGSTTVSSFGRMTSAANAYNSTLMRTRMLLTSTSGPGRVGQFSHGGYYQVGPGGGYIPLRRGSYKIGLGRFGNFMAGAGGMGIMAAGVGASMLSDELGGTQSPSGRVMSTVGNTMSGAFLGAQIGSLVPGIGTAIGGIVGGVGGILYSLYNNLKGLEEEINQQTGEAISVEQDRAKFKKELDDYSKLDWKQRAWLDLNGNIAGRNVSGKLRTPQEQEWTRVATNITINLDGKQVMNKEYTDRDIREMLDLGVQ